MYKVILNEKREMVVDADNFNVKDEGRVLFSKGEKYVAAFHLRNIMGFVEVENESS